MQQVGLGDETRPTATKGPDEKELERKQLAAQSPWKPHEELGASGVLGGVLMAFVAAAAAYEGECAAFVEPKYSIALRC